jgi:hypothetical protein
MSTNRICPAATSRDRPDDDPPRRHPQRLVVDVPALPAALALPVADPEGRGEVHAQRVETGMTRRTFALLFTLGLTAASVAGIAIGLAAAVTADRMRGIFGEVQWGEDD